MTARRTAGRSRGLAGSATRFAERARETQHVQRRRLVRGVAAGLGPLVVIAGIALSPALDVESVRVVGARRLPADQVRTAAAIRPGVALALVDTAAVRRRVAALPYVRSATVRREWPSRLVVEVVERVPALAVPVAGGVALYDADGVRLGGARTVPRGVPLLRVAGGRPAPALVKAVVAVVRSVPAEIRAQVLGYAATSPDEVVFALTGGREVVWGGADDAEAKARVLIALLRRPGTHYDVRAPGAPAVR